MSDITDLGEEFMVALSFRLFNYSDSDVIGATVTLEDPLGHLTYGFFSGVSLPDREEIRLDGYFTIPRTEYERWQAGSVPALRIEAQDSSGNTVRRTIELLRMPSGAEG